MSTFTHIQGATLGPFSLTEARKFLGPDFAGLSDELEGEEVWLSVSGPFLTREDAKRYRMACYMHAVATMARESRTPRARRRSPGGASTIEEGA